MLKSDQKNLPGVEQKEQKENTELKQPTLKRPSSADTTAAGKKLATDKTFLSKRTEDGKITAKPEKQYIKDPEGFFELMSSKEAEDYVIQVYKESSIPFFLTRHKFFSKKMAFFVKKFVKDEGEAIVLHIGAAKNPIYMIKSGDNPLRPNQSTAYKHVHHYVFDLEPVIKEAEQKFAAHVEKNPNIKLNPNVTFVPCDLNKDNFADILEKAKIPTNKPVIMMVEGMLLHLKNGKDVELFESSDKYFKSTISGVVDAQVPLTTKDEQTLKTEKEIFENVQSQTDTPLRKYASKPEILDKIPFGVLETISMREAMKKLGYGEEPMELRESSVVMTVKIGSKL